MMQKKSDVEHHAVRGIITGEEETPIDEIGMSLREALIPTNGILLDIERNTRGGAGGGGVKISLEGIVEAIQQALDLFFNPKPKT